MDQSDGKRLAALLEEIRDNQREQLSKQSQALELQQRQFAMMDEMHKRSMALQDRAESLQDKSVWIMEKGRKTFMVVIPILAVLLVYAGYLMLRTII